MYIFRLIFYTETYQNSYIFWNIYIVVASLTNQSSNFGGYAPLLHPVLLFKMCIDFLSS